MEATVAEELLMLAEQARSTMQGAEGATAIARVEQRYAEMPAAMDWFLDQVRPGDAVRLVSALVPFWMATKRIDDGDGWFERLIPRLGSGDRSRTRALYDHGYLVFWAGRHELAEERFDEARSLAHASGDFDLEALALAGSARVALDTDVDQAVRLLRTALEATEGMPESAGRSSAMHVLGVALQMSGDLEGAREVMSERIRVGQERGDDSVVWVESANLSMVERQLGDLARAEALSRDALRIVSGRGDQLAIPWVLNGLAAVTAVKGDHGRAAALLGMAEVMLKEAGGKWPPDEREQYEGTLATLSEAMGEEALARAIGVGADMKGADRLAFAFDEPGSEPVGRVEPV